MKKLFLAAGLLLMISGAAMAQTDTSKHTSHHGKMAHPKKMSSSDSTHMKKHTVAPVKKAKQN